MYSRSTGIVSKHVMPLSLKLLSTPPNGASFITFNLFCRETYPLSVIHYPSLLSVTYLRFRRSFFNL